MSRSLLTEVEATTPDRGLNGTQLTPNELLNWIAKEVTRFAKGKTRAIFVNQLTWC